ncbi:S-adenosyl-L-methionine-dependent methyltransferase [Lentinula edodes]|uniref:S-adenosyl-L-methionine-dependent methyltransferase n=1 Tax=Lentinula edodes TaxID=5353 RepID=UPI001E8D8031|nr:S-adenosyl-L-methionine-dependent methyltransferase [Lentinula edodes]KAH7874191.1 S-adenosyl-L-methionine-dependent methyltransferase [Lentinula edodes]
MSMTPDSQNLMSLVDLISNAVKVVTAEYIQAGYSVPSLDSTTAGPFDAPEEMSSTLTTAVRTIEAACAQLSYTVASPGHVITNKSYGFYEPAALLVISNAKVADVLLYKPEGMHISEIAKATGLDQGKLGRIMRMLATKHCFREVKPDVFANNRISVKLQSDDPVSGLVGHMTDEVQKGAVYLNEALSEPRSGHSVLASDTSFQRAHGFSVFEYYETAEGKKRLDRFAQAMIGWGAVTGKGMLPKAYPWNDCPAGTIINDVGGGNGHIMLDLIGSFPQLKIIVQDTPSMMEQAKDLWSKEKPELVQNLSVQFQAMNFLHDAPVASCDFYYLRHVLHDWPDLDCIKILSNIRKAVKHGTRLLLHELVLQHVVSDGSRGEQAPEPLLPNFGVGRARLYQQDMNMLNLFNSRERTLQEFITIGKKSNFKFIKLWDAGESSIVEFVVSD